MSRMATTEGKYVMAAPGATERGSLHKLMARRSTVGFLMTLPLITLLVVLVAYPAGSAIYLAMLDRGMTKFVGLDNFARLFASQRFWVLVYQTSLFAVVAVACQAIIGMAAAHSLHNMPVRGQRKWRGMVPWVIPPVMSMLAWRQLFDPSFSAFNWVLEHVGLSRISWLAEADWARFAVILATVWLGAPFFMIMYLAALKSVPDELYEASSIDGATGWQRMRYVTLPMTRNVMAITMLYALIGVFTGFTIVNVLTGGGPLGATQVLGTAAFYAGLAGGNFPRGAAIALCMVPVLTVAAIFILRGIARRGSEV